MIEKNEEARKLYSKGMKLVDIASKIGVPPGTVRRWKSIQHWDDGVSERSANVRKRKASVRAPDRKTLAAVESDSLTEPQKLFCLHYAKTFNATASAIKAGYSAKTAYSIGWNLLHNDRVVAEIKRLKAIRTSVMLAEASDVVEKYMQIAFADMSDYVEWGRYSTPVMGPFGPLTDKETGQQLTQEINGVRFHSNEDVDATIVTEVKVGSSGASVKLADRMKALEWLSNYFELNPADVHRREYDKRKLELDLLHAEQAAPPAADSALPDDGFTAALNASAAKVWDSDKPDDSSPDWSDDT